MTKWIMKKLYSAIFVVLILLMHLSSFQYSFAQQFTINDMVKFTEHSNFIKEFQIPLKEIGLGGITTDPNGDVWFDHSTNKTSTIIKMELSSGKFTQYDVVGNTVSDTPVINLAKGQLVFDNARNVLWFTDARTNSVGKLDVKSGKIQLMTIPTQNAGPMGIALSPDNKNVWFAEILGNKIASLDVESNKIIEYSTGQDGGPIFLTFDNNGQLWASLLSHKLIVVDPRTLIPGFTIPFSIILPKPDIFSPFGITVINDKSGSQRIFVSDHGSSRIISSYIDLQTYTSYWTSPSQPYPVTLPSQLVDDKSGNIYIAEHGGNRIAKINVNSGIMTEYEIPTGPLSTTLFVAISNDGKKVWFTEWASNKIAYLDTTIPVPLNLYVKNDHVRLDLSSSKSLEVVLERNSTISSPISFREVDLSVIGMTDSGLKGVTYSVSTPRFDLENNTKVESQINLKADERALPGNYNIMVRASASEKDSNLIISQLYPISIVLDVPTPSNNQNSIIKNERISGNLMLHQLIQLLFVAVAIGLIGFLVYSRIRRSKSTKIGEK